MKFRYQLTLLAFLLFSICSYAQDLSTGDDCHKLQTKNEILAEELNELIIKYNNVVILNEIMDEHLMKAKKRIEQLQDSIQHIKTSR